MSRKWLIIVVILLLPWGAAGCAKFQSPRLDVGESPLAPLKPRAEQIGLDVVFVRLSPREAATVESIWDEADEQALPHDVRRRLARNGYRVGFLGRELPAAVHQLLASSQDAAADSGALDPSQRTKPGVTRHQLYLRPARRAELVVSPVQPQLHALVWNDAGVEGTTFDEAQAQFAVQADTGSDGRTQLQLIPEIHHGPLQQHYAGGNAMFRLDSRRKREDFGDLAIAASLAPGEVLVLGRRATHTGTLGDRFFGSADSSQVAERLILVRLSEERTDPLFAAAASREDTADEKPSDSAGSE